MDSYILSVFPFSIVVCSDMFLLMFLLMFLAIDHSYCTLDIYR